MITKFDNTLFLDRNVCSLPISKLRCNLKNAEFKISPHIVLCIVLIGAFYFLKKLLETKDDKKNRSNRDEYNPTIFSNEDLREVRETIALDKLRVKIVNEKKNDEIEKFSSEFKELQSLVKDILGQIS